MKDTQFENLIHCKVVNGVFYPINSNANDFVYSNEGQEVYLVPQTQRDLILHACYFAFCNWLWQELPKQFKLQRCPNRADMYKYLKLVQGKYKESMKYKDITAIEFESISFGNMSNEAFKDYVNEQIIALYENILIPLKMEDLYEKANEEFSNLFKKLI